jgi:hypothetical protein
MKITAYLALIGISSASDDTINFSYMKKRELANTEDIGILSMVSNWFSSSVDLSDQYHVKRDEKPKRNLQLNTQYQFFDYTYNILADYQYKTYYNYVYQDLYNTVYSENYNYKYNIYTYYSTTTTQTVTYSIYYKPPTYSTYKVPT